MSNQRHQDDELNIFELIETIWNGKKTVAIITALSFGVSLIFLAITPNKYEASVSVQKINKIQLSKLPLLNYPLGNKNKLNSSALTINAVFNDLLTTLSNKDLQIEGIEKYSLLEKGGMSDTDFNYSLMSFALSNVRIIDSGKKGYVVSIKNIRDKNLAEYVNWLALKADDAVHSMLIKNVMMDIESNKKETLRSIKNIKNQLKGYELNIKDKEENSNDWLLSKIIELKSKLYVLEIAYKEDFISSSIKQIPTSSEEVRYMQYDKRLIGITNKKNSALILILGVIFGSFLGVFTVILMSSQKKYRENKHP